jgi:hypothetical protein
MSKAPTYEELRRALEQALEHLDWTGWGDSWERECARDSGMCDDLPALLKRATESPIPAQLPSRPSDGGAP